MLIVLSLSIAGLILAGHAVASARGPSAVSLDRAALACAAGILLDYSLVLCGLRLTYVLVAMGLLAAWGLVKAARGWWVARRTPSGRAVAWWMCLPIAYILGLYYVVVLSEPVFRWDARVIWFFHAKMIWIEGALRSHTGFAHPSLAFSHPDYPNLVPTIAAQLASCSGFWNEFLPKASLLVVLVPPVLWASTFGRQRAGLILIVLVAFFSLDGWLAAGLMDPYVGLYLGMALLLSGRFAVEGRKTDLLSLVCALGIIAGLKNEGVLVVMSFGAAVLAAALFTDVAVVTSEMMRLVRDRLFLRIVMLSAVPTLIWAGLKAAWGLHSDMTGDLGVNAARVAERLSDSRVSTHLFHYLVTRPTALWWMAGLFLVAVALLKAGHRRVPGAAIVAAFTSVMYFCAMYLVYLATPHDLNWQLTTSAPRTMFPTSVAFLVALYLVVSGGGQRAPSGDETGVARAAG